MVLEQLDEAIRLSWPSAYVSSLTLAGAAEAILSDAMKAQEQLEIVESSVVSFKDAALDMIVRARENARRLDLARYDDVERFDACFYNEVVGLP